MAILFGGAIYLCNFGRGHYWELSCEMVLNLDQWFSSVGKPLDHLIRNTKFVYEKLLIQGKTFRNISLYLTDDHF